MKQFKIFFLFVLSFLVLFTVTGCGNKTAISAEDFKTKLEDKGYSIQDASNQFNDDTQVQKVYLAIDSDSKYQIEFYEFDNEENATEFFNLNKHNFENTKTVTVYEASSSVGNHSKYTLISNNKYKVVSRIGNTAIYLDVDDSYKEDVKKLLKELDY